ncbi:N-acyl-D-glucosamine 2-epimerase [Flavobacterium sp. WLB]|uniref:AGE family epimerase/isomerase n=1 Tax=unclassified Flavobacterium TaxID=196869 RepID=UPI0006ABA60D|nr:MULTISPECIES: AGE family epimerase/isomerase [unclassified Flavobacterium]KOP36283.1 N-acyl-D-glucosamine 2-epimerase [Flavobacterium sp. VMW]OWU90442.1 N-acyl-D-glucosamine 2-epimerase [Flavobacterium sp. NLM]PUU70525.1 N-acyl-D-glucosamine 2-epimerase [Flavobacterium sp. WLB]
MCTTVKQLKTELTTELDSILNYWIKHTLDTQNEGFIGQIDFNDHLIANAEKGAVLNSRILWTFSSSYQVTKKENHKKIAERAFDFLSKYFYDAEFGGLFWSINVDKTPKDTKNQIYALAFAIYGLTEYYAISKDEKALEIAKNLYFKIQEHSYDPVNKGYLEAFTRNWQPIDDLRLSDKDANEKKTMNTHLHIIEAYANLYKVWKDETLRKNSIELLQTIEKHFINTETGHLRLFFDENWIEKPDVISYGHDIEAAWLLLQCAEILEDENLVANYRKHAVQIAEVTKEGLDSDGGLWYEFDPEKNELIAEKHWWVQAEALIGFYNAYQLTGNEDYLEIVFKNWKFIKKYILDLKNGEWFWGIYRDYSLIEKDKAGFWKCPYHNSRACMELIQRIKD